MNETQLLDELVGRFDEPAEWEDVLRRAGALRFPRRRLALRSRSLWRHSSSAQRSACS
jgi:hypothetical protein